MRWPLLLLLLVACDDAPVVEVTAVERGSQVFHEPRFSDSQFNVFSCATCHRTDNGTPTIATSLLRTTDRASWWNGNFTTLLDAVDFCWVGFMRGFRFDPTSDDARALFEYLDSLGTGEPLPGQTFTIVESVAALPRGDSDAGRDVYDASCRSCHGDIHTGDGRMGSLVSVIPEASIEFAEESGFDVRLVITEKVRHGQFFGVGGNMPHYPLEVLSDEAMSDLLEYLVP